MGNILQDRLRAWHHRLRPLWSSACHRLLFHLTEWEAIALRPGAKAPWRKRYLPFRGMRHGSPCYIGCGFWLQYDGAFSFGRRCSFGEFARIINHASISVGDDFMVATGLRINSGDHDPVTVIPASRPIAIRHRAWCGAKVTIRSGVIADDVVIRAASLVLDDIPANTVVAGVPARPARTIVRAPTHTRKWTT